MWTGKQHLLYTVITKISDYRPPIIIHIRTPPIVRAIIIMNLPSEVSERYPSGCVEGGEMETVKLQFWPGAVNPRATRVYTCTCQK